MTLSKTLTSTLFLLAGMSLAAPAFAKPHGPPGRQRAHERHERKHGRAVYVAPPPAPRPVYVAPPPAPRPVVVAPRGPAIYVDLAPPAPRFEARPLAPAPGYVWVDGYWSWGGAQYVWVPGQWQAPRAGYTWRPARWVQDGGRWRMVHGHWKRR